MCCAYVILHVFTTHYRNIRCARRIVNLITIIININNTSRPYYASERLTITSHFAHYINSIMCACITFYRQYDCTSRCTHTMSYSFPFIHIATKILQSWFNGDCDYCYADLVMLSTQIALMAIVITSYRWHVLYMRNIAVLYCEPPLARTGNMARISRDPWIHPTCAMSTKCLTWYASPKFRVQAKLQHPPQ